MPLTAISWRVGASPKYSPECVPRRPTGDYLVSFGELVFYGDLEVGKGNTVDGDVPLDAFRAVHVLGKAGVVQDVV
jgi:hypothetical protein